MTTWNNGRRNLMEKIKQQTTSLEYFITEILSVRLIAIPGTAIYMAKSKTERRRRLFLILNITDFFTNR